MDPDLATHLCMGLGTEETQRPATFVDSHVRSCLSLRKPRKGSGNKTALKVSAQRGVGKVLSRYLAACRDFCLSLVDVLLLPLRAMDLASLVERSCGWPSY